MPVLYTYCAHICIVRPHRQQVLFRHLEKEQKEFVARAMFVMEFKNGDTIITQGDNGDNFYVIDRGNVECFKYEDGPEDETLVHTYSPGGAFGELAIMYNAPRAATCRAISDCRLYALDRKVLSEYLDRLYKVPHRPLK